MKQVVARSRDQAARRARTVRARILQDSARGWLDRLPQAGEDIDPAEAPDVLERLLEAVRDLEGAVRILLEDDVPPSRG